MITKNQCESAGCEFCKHAKDIVRFNREIHIPDVCGYDDLPLQVMVKCPLNKIHNN